MIQIVWHDLRYAFRALRRAPAFVTLAVCTLAIGIGANAALFSVVDAVLLRPLPFPRPHELVIVGQVDRRTRAEVVSDTTPANFLDWRQRAHAFSGLAAFRQDRLTIVSNGPPERRPSAMVNANFFDVLGLHAAIGRTFASDEEGRRAARVAVISDALWRDRFGSAHDIVGRTIRLEDEPYTIIGVMAPGVDYPSRAQIWITPHWAVPDDPQTSVDPSTERDHSYFYALARLRPGITREAANAEMANVAAGLEREYPDANRDVTAVVAPLRDDLVVADVKSTTLVLFAAVALLLLVATANVSGLLMARAASRHQEIAVRIALGAGRSRIVAQLLTESLLLAALGGGAGLLLAMWLTPALVAMSPIDLAAAGPIAIDRTVLVFGIVVSAACGLLFGVAPARQLSRVDVSGDLKESSRGASGRRQRRVRAAVVAAEIALSLVLLVAAALTVRSFAALQRVPVGFDPAGVTTVQIAPSTTRYRSQAQRADFWQRAVAAVRSIPGVENAAAVSRLPMTPGNSGRGLTIPGRPPDAQPTADYRTVSPDYFAVMRIPLLRGRSFAESDSDSAPRVAILSQATADRYWTGVDPIGRRFAIGTNEYTIVGIVGDIRAFAVAESPRPMLYVPYRQDAFPFMSFVVRGVVDQGTVRAAIWSVDKEQFVGPLRSLDDEIAQSLARRRFSVTLLTAFGGTALLLAAVGLYGVLAFVVSQRRREIGVRMALGATARDLVRQILGEGLRLLAAGMTCGIVLSLGVTRVMSSLLFGISPTDALSFVAAAAVLAAIAVAASLVPAVRASRVDPLQALRDE